MSAPMTEQQIERIAERRMDRLDSLLMSGQLEQAEYDEAVKDLDKETEALHASNAALRNHYALNLGNVPTTCVETIAGESPVRLTFQIKVF